jgi:7,8-dihydroneopterin aldolase/epimerase/oxygenase
MTVFIAGLELPAQIGVHAHEYGRLQILSFDIDVRLAPARIDSIADTVDYETLVKLTEHVLANGHIQLVETVARCVADAVQAACRVEEVTVKVTKPSALRGARSAGVVWSTRAGMQRT